MSPPVQCDLCRKLYPLPSATLPVSMQDGKLSEVLLQNMTFDELRKELKKVVPNDVEFSRQKAAKQVSANRLAYAEDCYDSSGGKIGTTGGAVNVLYACYRCVGQADHNDPDYYLCDKLDPVSGRKVAQITARWLNRRRTCLGRSTHEDEAACENIMK